MMTAAVAVMLQVHRSRGTWNDSIDGYVALTQFARDKFIQGGLPAAAVHVKPNFLESDPGQGSSSSGPMLYIGRLSAEKGVEVLIEAWRHVPRSVQLVVIGEGPLRRNLEAAASASGLSNVTFAGWLSRPKIFAALQSASALVVPSVCYEGFPMTLVEAFACGTPVLGSNLGSVQEIIKNQENGLHFQSGDPFDLAAKVEWASTHPAELAVMGAAARRDFEQLYTADKNYQMLLQIYEKAISRASKN
jgi:glycosyltransferase involved in cell wall biosynthesis